MYGALLYKLRTHVEITGYTSCVRSILALCNAFSSYSNSCLIYESWNPRETDYTIEDNAKFVDIEQCMGIGIVTT